MKRIVLFGTVALLIVLGAAQVFAQESKLDARARIALSELQAPGASATRLRATGTAVTATGQLDVFIRGDVSRAQLEAMGVNVRTELPGLFTADVPVDVVDQLAARADVAAINGAALCEQYLNTSVPTTGANALRGAAPTFTGMNGAGVLVGDVDSGIDWKHKDFKDASLASRILYIWDQSVTTGTPPSGFTKGREWTKSQIDLLQCTENDTGTVANGDGHGSHVMGIAAGNGQGTGAAIPAYTYVGMAPMADIAMVKTTFYTTDIIDGVNYLFQKAAALGKNAVVNLSLGSEYGPHDGTSTFESALDALSGPGKVVVVAAGNDRGTSWHAAANVPATGDSVKFTVTSGNVNGALLAFDGYYNAPDNMTVTLRSPGNKIITLPMGGINKAYPGDTTGVNGVVYFENGASLTSTGAREVYIEIMSTGSTAGKTTTGVWTLTFTPVSQAASTTRFDMWRFYSNYPSATFTYNMVNDHLVSEPGNAARVITVAAWETKNSWTRCSGTTVSYSGPAPIGAIATFSGIGPTRDGRNKPDLAAPGMGIGSTRSSSATGTCGSQAFLLNDNGVHVINQGTSMAAPHVAGATAILMQKFGAMTPEQVKTYLFSHATIDANTGAPWNNSFGMGKLHLGDLLDPSVLVAYPNGAEILFIGTPTTFTWTASDNVAVTSVDVLLSRTGPAGPWETIASGVPNSGSYNWLVTAPTTGAAYARIVAHDAENNTAADLSDAAFTIASEATATLLSTFVANPTAKGIELRWALASPGSFSDLAVERATNATGPWTSVAASASQDGDQFVVVDEDVVSGQSYVYRLTGRNAGGVQTTLGQITGTAGQPITEFALTRIAPNPSRGGITAVEFTVPRSANVKITVHDVLGRTVATLSDGDRAPGRYQVMWSGEIHGRRAAAGQYFVRMQAPGVHATRRVTVVSE